MILPSALFLGHGAPSLALSQHPATQFLRELGQKLGSPRALILASAHRQGSAFEAGQARQFSAWHDFSGFSEALYQLQYAPPGAPELAQRAAKLIAEAGLQAGTSSDARIDHGIWVPLRLMWPEQNIPVVPISLRVSDPRAHYQLGRALQTLCTDNVMLIGSGSITHNLRDIDQHDEYAAVTPWAAAFDQWIAAAIAKQDIESLLNYRELAPNAAHAHPHEDHLMPLFVALGAGAAGTPLFSGFSHASLSLSAYAFE